MSKEFNVNGVCIPELHYMVNIDERIKEIKELVDKGKYFVINRARQYGKTTTLDQLKDKLDEEYTVYLISFEGFTDGVFKDETTFCRRFCGLIYDSIYYGLVKDVSDDYKKGYLISFNFNKNKQIGVHEIMIGDKVILEAVL